MEFSISDIDYVKELVNQLLTVVTGNKVPAEPVSYHFGTKGGAKYRFEIGYINRRMSNGDYKEEFHMTLARQQSVYVGPGKYSMGWQQLMSFHKAIVDIKDLNQGVVGLIGHGSAEDTKEGLETVLWRKTKIIQPLVEVIQRVMPRDVYKSFEMNFDAYDHMVKVHGVVGVSYEIRVYNGTISRANTSVQIKFDPNFVQIGAGKFGLDSPYSYQHIQEVLDHVKEDKIKIINMTVNS